MSADNLPRYGTFWRRPGTRGVWRVDEIRHEPGAPKPVVVLTLLDEHSILTMSITTDLWPLTARGKLMPVDPDALEARVAAVRAYDKRVRPSLPELHPSEVVDDVIYLLDGGNIDALHWGQEAGDE